MYVQKNYILEEKDTVYSTGYDQAVENTSEGLIKT